MDMVNEMKGITELLNVTRGLTFNCPGLVVIVVMGRDSCAKGHEFESQHCALDGYFFTYLFVVKIAMCV